MTARALEALAPAAPTASPSAPNLPVPAPAPEAAAVTAALSALAAGDGKTVALAAGDAVATGGDTPLGRILTRALRAEAPQPRSPSPGVEISPENLAQPAATAASSAAAGANVEAFVRAFANALDRRSPADGATDAPTAPAAGAQTSTVPAFAAAIGFAAPDALTIVPAAPAVTAPPAPPTDANAVVDQVLRGIGIRTSDGSSEVHLRLVPEALGDVSVKLTVSGGVVDAALTASTVDAQNALAAAQQQLARTLADAGLKLQSFTVALAGGSFANSGDGQRDASSWQKNARRIGGIASALFDDENVADADNLLAIPSFGPPIYTAGAMPGHLEYLV